MTADFATPETEAEVELLKRFIEHAPQNPGVLSDELAGWWTPAGNYVCARCAGRIMARGCQLPRGTEPAWNDQPTGVCCTH